MADGPGMDQGAQAFARGLGGGGGGGADDGKNSEDDANSKDMLEWAVSGGGRGLAVAHKLVLGPIGINLSKFGKVSLSYVFGGDSEGFAGKNIMPGSGGLLPETSGGLLYQIAKALMRNREVTDHTGGVGGNPHLLADNGGGGGGGGGGAAADWGGGDSGGGPSFASFAASSGMSDMFIAAGGGNNFSVRDVPESILGTISPPNFGDAGFSRGAGFGAGLA